MQAFHCVRTLSSRCRMPSALLPSRLQCSFSTSNSISSLHLNLNLNRPVPFSSLSRTFSSVPPSKSKSPPSEFPELVPGVDQADNWGHLLEKIKWADFRTNVVTVEATRNEEGDLEGEIGGEKVIFPEQEPTLEWVLSTPVDLHLFEESPIVKECPESDATPDGH